MNTASAHSSRFSLRSSPARALRFAEDGLAAIALLVMAALPVGDLVLRTLTDHGIPGAVEYTQHLSLWVGFLGAIVAARTGQHISLARKDPADDTTTGSLDSVVAIISCTVCLLLAWAVHPNRQGCANKSSSLHQDESERRQKGRRRRHPRRCR